MIKFKLIVACIFISLIFLQFVDAQSYDTGFEYDEDEFEYKENEYRNFPTFGLRESTNNKLNDTRSHSKRTERTEPPVQQTTPTPRRMLKRRRTTLSPASAPIIYEPTQRVQVIPTSSPRSKLHEPGRISTQLTRNEFVFANEIEQTKNFTLSEDIQQQSEESNFDPITSEESKSPSRFIETTYEIDHSPYGDPYDDNGYNKPVITNHNFESKDLFSSDVSAEKIENSDGSGYFKTTGKYDLNKLSNRYNKYPVHDKLKTDLAVADLQLHSFPRPLKNFKLQHLPSFHHTIEKPSTNSPATKEQIKLYNDDVNKYYDRLLEEQLRTSRDPADKAIYHQFIKAMEDEKIEQQSTSIRDLKRQRTKINSGRPRPFISHEIRAKSPEKTFGLGYYKLGQLSISERPYKFPFL